MFHNAMHTHSEDNPQTFVIRRMNWQTTNTMRPELIPQGGDGVITPSLLVGCGFLIIIYNQDELDNHCIMQWKSLLDARWLNAFLPSLQVLGFMYVVESFIIVVKRYRYKYIHLSSWMVWSITALALVLRYMNGGNQSRHDKFVNAKGQKDQGCQDFVWNSGRICCADCQAKSSQDDKRGLAWYYYNAGKRKGRSSCWISMYIHVLLRPILPFLRWRTQD